MRWTSMPTLMNITEKILHSMNIKCRKNALSFAIRSLAYSIPLMIFHKFFFSYNRQPTQNGQNRLAGNFSVLHSLVLCPLCIEWKLRTKIPTKSWTLQFCTLDCGRFGGTYMAYTLYIHMLANTTYTRTQNTHGHDIEDLHETEEYLENQVEKTSPFAFCLPRIIFLSGLFELC